jgi:hypothetical protein
MEAIVAEQGYAGATVARVIARAEVSRTAFYECFANREDCFHEGADAGSPPAFERWREWARRSAVMPPRSTFNKTVFGGTGAENLLVTGTFKVTNSSGRALKIVP